MIEVPIPKDNTYWTFFNTNGCMRCNRCSGRLCSIIPDKCFRDPSVFKL